MGHWVVIYGDVAHLITLNLGKVEKKYAKLFDAGLKFHIDSEEVKTFLYRMMWTVLNENRLLWFNNEYGYHKNFRHCNTADHMQTYII